MGAISPAISLIDNLAMGLLAKHEQRIQIAKEENGATQQAVVALDADLHTIFTAANAGDITTASAISACQSVESWYWQFITPFQQGSLKGNNCGTVLAGGLGATPNVQPGAGACYKASTTAPCSGKECTAGCCIGCNVVNASLANAIALFKAAKNGTISVCTVIGNKYGLQTRQGYTLSYTVPAKVTQEEVTINAKTGIVSVGAPPSTQDAIVTKGVVIQGAQADQGGVAGVTAAGATQTQVGTPGAIVGGLNILGHEVTYTELAVGAAFVIAALLLLAPKREPRYVVVAGA